MDRPDKALISDQLASFLFHHPPTLDDILGAVCEVYRVDPDEIREQRGSMARTMFCHCASRWARIPNIEVGAHVGVDTFDVGKAFHFVVRRIPNDDVMRADLDLLVVRVVERTLLRRRLGL